MKHGHWIFIFMFLLGCSHPPIQTAPWHREIAGTVSEIDRDDSRFVVSSLDLETGVTRIFQFKTDLSTRYRNATGFRDLEAGDWASVDFAQNQKGEFVAKNVAVNKQRSGEEAEGQKSRKPAFLE